MTDNIISYVDKYKRTGFDQMPFNEVDSLVLCQLSYLNFKDLVPGIKELSTSVSLQDIVATAEKDRLYEEYWFKEDNRKLVEKVTQSFRFMDMKLNYFVEVLNEEHGIQFSAVTFLFGDKSVYVAFRGTDVTLVGWKEDMMLACSEPLRSQELAAEYLDKVSSTFAGQFRVGGHSKGGNLAVYAAMFCKSDVRRRICDIYDHDGPGFRPEILKEGHFDFIRSKVHKYIPKESIVGILLETNMDYEVVESTGIGALQHNTFTWKSKNGQFVKAKGMRRNKRVADAALNEWIYSLSDREVSVFIDTLFDILAASDAKTLFEIIEDPKKSVSGVFSAYKELDKTTKSAVFSTIRKLGETLGERTFENLVERTKILKLGDKDK